MKQMERKACVIAGMCSQSIRYKTDESRIILKLRLKKLMEYMIKEHGVNCFLSGMSPSIEFFGAELAVDIKKSNPKIVLECVEAFEYQGMCNFKSKAQLSLYKKVISVCDSRTVICNRYVAGCGELKRKYLVDNSDYIIAVWERLPREQMGIVSYAKKKELPVIQLNPVSLEIMLPIDWGIYD